MFADVPHARPCLSADYSNCQAAELQNTSPGTTLGGDMTKRRNGMKYGTESDLEWNNHTHIFIAICAILFNPAYRFYYRYDYRIPSQRTHK